MINNIRISGVVCESKYLNRKYNRVVVEVKRTSGKSDLLPVLIKSNVAVNVGDHITVNGELKTFDDKYSRCNKLKSYIRAKTIDFSPYNNVDNNYIDIEGIIVKTPVFRLTATGRRIQRFIIANNCPDANYIPCIVWGEDATIKRNTGDKIRITGRWQSRTYLKDGRAITVYEISADSVRDIPVSTNYQQTSCGYVEKSTFVAFDNV